MRTLMVFAFTSVLILSARAHALEMDEEVIYGTRRTSTLFLKLEKNTKALSSIIYNRTDFNDYHEVESRDRLKSIFIESAADEESSD